MSKPTLFFSHSSKDKELILKLKEMLMTYTGRTLNIFMSSDGQSIPFGTNWIHKIEEGLNDAKIMFVFVTANSISSGWIYFEAGFAYSKGIRVIPVGIGINIGALKAPLNLLQGFNLTSEDSLNNFISIVNKEFDYSFTEKFCRSDYINILSNYLDQGAMTIPFDEMVQSISFTYPGIAYSGSGKPSFRQNGKLFSKIESFFDENGVKYSKSDRFDVYGTKSLSALGLIIKCILQKHTARTGSTSESTQYEDVSISISPYNFEKSFALYLKLNKLFEEATQFYIHICLKEEYALVHRQEDYSALLLEYPTRFERIKEYVGSFKCAELDLSFAIFDKNNGHRNPNYVLSVGYSPDDLNPRNIETLVDWLIEAKVIIRNPNTGRE